MPRIAAIEPELATAKAKALMEDMRSATGMVGNLIKTMANAPAVLEAFVGFDEALAKGVLTDQERERIALTVAEINGCEYSLAAHCALGRLAGLSEEEIQDSRRGISPDRRIEAIMQFARQVVVNRGRVSDKSLDDLGRLGCGPEEITEITANVILAQFSNYFNFIAGTERDFPRAPDLAALAAEAQSPGFQDKETSTPT